MADAPDAIPRLHTLPVRKRDEFIDFWNWFSLTVGLKTRFFRWAAVPAIIASMLAIVFYALGIIKNLWDRPLISHPFSPPSLDDAIIFSYGVQIIVIFVVLVIYGGFVDVAEVEGCEYGNEGQKRVRFWWSVALLSFLLLYIFLWVRAWLSAEPKQPSETLQAVIGILSNLCNNLSTFAFLMCFSTMESPAKPNGRGKNDRWVLLWCGCLVMLTFVEAAVRIRYASAVNQWNIDWFDLLAGANAGIALAMFCGRLASPLINPPLSVMIPLYFYAVLQITFGFWGKQKSVGLVMANFCLILKCLLSFVIAWLLTTRHLIFYMERMHRTRSQLEEWRKEFREPAVTR